MSITYGITRLRRLQLGREAVAGTAVTPTVLWLGPAQMPEDDSPRVFAEQHIGTRAPTNRSYRPALKGVCIMPTTEATFEHLPHIFEGGIDAETPVQDASGGYVRAYDLFAENTPKAYTMLGGNNIDTRRLTYSFVEQFVLSGETDGAVMLQSANWRGRQVTTGTSFASLSAAAVEEILFNSGKLYIDSTTIGSTQAEGVWLGFNLSVTTGWIPVGSGDGELYFHTIKNVGGDAELQITLEHTSVAAAEKAHCEGGTLRKIRLTFEGAAISGGSTYSAKTLIVDAEGLWLPDSFRTLQDQNGDDIMIGTLRASALDFVIVNNVAAL